MNAIPKSLNIAYQLGKWYAQNYINRKFIYGDNHPITSHFKTNHYKLNSEEYNDWQLGFDNEIVKQAELSAKK